MAVHRVEELLRKVTQALDAAQVPYAVVGGNAVAAWVASVDESATRATKDVDLLLRRADLETASHALHATGLILEHAFGLYMFLDAQHPSPRTGVHVILANEPVIVGDRYPAPDPSASACSVSGFRVLGLRELVAMKLQSNRPIDQAHIEDLLELGLVDDRIRDELPDDLRSRFDELAAEWRRRARPGST